MRKQTVLSFTKMCMMSMLLTGCRSCGPDPLPPEPVPAPQFDMYAPGENFTALSQVTEGDYRCDYPFGGDNGRNLSFVVHDRNGIFSNIYFKKDNPINRAMTQKTDGKNHHIAPTYSPAKDKIAFAGQQEGASVRDIYMISASQGDNTLTQVTNTPNYEENYPCFTRDGNRIVYERRPSYGKAQDNEVWVKNLQSGENSMLCHGRMPSFSADGRNIVYVKYMTGSDNTCLCVMNADGSNQIQVTGSGMGFVSHPRFSPNGQQIVFQCMKPEKHDFDLYVIDRNGNNLTQLTQNKSYDGEPYWSDEGYIYFASDRGGFAGNYQIWRFKYGQATPVSTSGSPVGPTAAATHVVERGETISSIAQRYGVAVRDLLKWNGLQSMTLTPGMKLRVSAP